MILTIEITPEIESRLEVEARRSGISKTDLAKNVIEERFAPKEKREDILPREIKSKIWSSNIELSNALNDAYADDTDEEEKDFLRLMKIKQSQILDEWK